MYQKETRQCGDPENRPQYKYFELRRISTNIFFDCFSLIKWIGRMKRK